MEKIVSIYIVYEINYDISSYPTLESCLSGAVTLTNNDDVDKYKYSGCGIGFDSERFFSVGNAVGKTFEVDMSSYSHIDNKKKNILISVKGPTQALEHTLASEKMNPIDFTENNTNFV